MIRIYCDIDGCLNPFPKMGKTGDFDDFTNQVIKFPKEDAGWLNGSTLTVRLSTKMATALKELGGEIVFNTTWCDHPEQLQELASHIGLQGTRQLYFDGAEAVAGKDYPWMHYADRKLFKMIEDVKKHNEPFIWIDDDVIDDIARTTLKKDTSLPPHLLCIPDRKTGITQENIETMQNFVKEHHG